MSPIACGVDATAASAQTKRAKKRQFKPVTTYKIMSITNVNIWGQFKNLFEGMSLLCGNVTQFDSEGKTKKPSS